VISAHPIRVDLLNKSFKTRHPTWSKMAVLEEHPGTTLHCNLHHLFSDRTLHGINTNQPHRPTQPPIISGMGIDYRATGADALGYSSFYSRINVWTAGKTLRELVTRAVTECFRDKVTIQQQRILCLLYITSPTVGNSRRDFIRDQTICAYSFRRFLKTYLFAQYQYIQRVRDAWQ